MIRIRIVLLALIGIVWSVSASLAQQVDFSNFLKVAPSPFPIHTQEFIQSRLGAFDEAEIARRESKSKRLARQLLERAALIEFPIPMSSKYPSTYVIPRRLRPMVMNQGKCGSCVGWATATAMAISHYVSINKNDFTLPSPLRLLAQATAGKFKCKTGAQTSEVARFTAKDGKRFEVSTDALAALYPRYRRSGPFRSTFLQPTAKKAHSTRAGTITDESIKVLKGITKYDAFRFLLSKNIPLTTGFRVYKSFSHYDGGIYNHNEYVKSHPATNKKPGGHAVTVIGYHAGGNLDFSQLSRRLFGKPSGPKVNIYSPPFWIVQNSWGENWGFHGYFFIAPNDGTGFDKKMNYFYKVVEK